MGIFNFKSQNKNTNSNSEADKWEEFCKLDESFKSDSKLKPIYYLKLYGKNIVYTNPEIKNRAKSDFIRAISDNLKNEDKTKIKSLIDYLINMKY